MYKKYAKKALLILGGLFITYYIYLSDPSKGPILPCIFNKITGFYCPSCGMSRAFNAFLHLHIYQSFRFNALPYIFLPFFVVLYYRYPTKKSYNFILYFMILISLIYMFLRNINHFQFLTPLSII